MAKTYDCTVIEGKTQFVKTAYGMQVRFLLLAQIFNYA